MNKDHHTVCIAAISTDVKGNDYLIEFNNCIFVGFDHAFVSSCKNIKLAFNNCMFKSQCRESILLPDLPRCLNISECIFKRGCQVTSEGAMISLHGRGSHSTVNIHDSIFKKSHG